MNQKEIYMQEAITEAKKALGHNDVPVGAVVVKDKTIIGRGHNTRERDNDPAGHAEMNAIAEAAASLGTWFLNDCDIYVTLEPCMMCSGAIMQSRIKTVYFGARDPKGGCLVSVVPLFEIKGFQHYPSWYEGLCQEECTSLLTSFFQNKRGSGKNSYD
ncbi:MAG: nucleoside deaminase [Erysipelotrichaceae bacterium]|jgi:tRNA(adenine34) deaminase|nr:nucleoside deaminase [Erysipelotrichaceae bacterium]